MDSFRTYSEFDYFWQSFRPLTPYGKESKNQQALITEITELLPLHQSCQEALHFLQEVSAASLTRLHYHLQRLPRFPENAQPLYDETELFEIKKFLYNYRFTLSLLPEKLQNYFAMPAGCPELESLLSKGCQAAETFSIANEYSQALKETRQNLKACDQALQAAKNRQEELIGQESGLFFGNKAFLIVERSLLDEKIAAVSPQSAPGGNLAPSSASTLTEWLQIEPFDKHHYCVRLRQRPEELQLQTKRSELLSQERLEENLVLSEIAAAVRQALPQLRRCRQAVGNFDLALARAQLAQQYNLVAPEIATTGPLSITAGRFIPCSDLCAQNGRTYQPLHLTLTTPATVIFGSNMGGKTIALKTTAFLQMCVQFGLFVPAEHFTTRLFKHFHYVGEINSGGPSRQGLSGFGFEIRQLTAAWQDCQEQATMVVFDEFARTTNSAEAEALISAMLERLEKHDNLRVLFSTHFRGLARLAGTTYLRMQGLDRQRLEEKQVDAAAPAGGLGERIKLIDSYMNYTPVPDNAATPIADALAIASLLGIEPQLAERAQAYFRSTTGRTKL